MNILFIGDVVGRVGREAVAALLPGLKERYSIHFTIANCENAAGGIGVTERTGEELLGAGVDVLTGGNHVWDKREAYAFLDSCGRIVRPANYPHGVPGRGAVVLSASDGTRVGVVNLQGRVFMHEIDCPFKVGEGLVDDLRSDTPIVVVDVHAEATAEKQALGWHLAGRATAVLGTHTHVQTADERILEEHTAYITDVGMTGPVESVIGIRKELSLARFLTQLPQRFSVAGGTACLDGVVIEVDGSTGAALSIERVAAVHEREVRA